MSDSDSFSYPPPRDEAYQSKVRQQASIALWGLLNRTRLEPGDKITMSLSVETQAGVMHDRRVLVAPCRNEK
jgi:hypothetical protein